MGLDLRFSPEPSLQEGFLDKSTGLPLSFGLVFFYSDVNRTVLKPIYELSGSPPNYTYTPLPNPVILSGIGTIQDGSGNDVIPYFFPFDANGNVELYYIVVTDQFGVQQFTRQGFPNVGTNVNPPNVLNFSQNFIPNGQFLLWNPPASYPTTTYTFNYGGGVTNTVIDVAPGGWNFQVSSGSNAVYTIKFNQLLATLLNPSSSPRYEIEITRSGISVADLISDLRIRFMDVNKFQSNGTNDTWTLIFNAEALAQLPGVTVHLIKYFGTNAGSGTPADTTEDIVWGGPVTFTTNQQVFAFPNVFGDNTGKTIGNNNDDFIEFAIRFPAALSQTWDVKLTDFMLINQNITQAQAAGTAFPATTNGEFVLQALSNLAPTTTSSTTSNYYQEDGSNLFLPMVMTQRGFTYDYSQVGKIEALSNAFGFTSSISNITNLIICDGSTYVTANFSSLGIPFARLQKVLFDALDNSPIYGTGINFGQFYINSGNTSQIIIDNNNALIQSLPVDGATPTGFTFPVSSLSPGAAHIGFNGHVNPTNGAVVALGTFTVGTFGGNGFSAGTSGMTGGDYNSPLVLNLIGYYYAFTVTALSAAALAAGAGNPGLYFDFSNNTTNYRMWFQVTTEIAPAAAGRTLIQVNLFSTMGVLDVANVISEAISRNQVDSLIVTGVPPASSYFSFFTNGNKNNVFYVVGGTGTAPPTPTGVNIQVNLTGTETTAQVATKTQIAVNSYQFAVPDLRGQFLRGFDPTGLVDTENNVRYVTGRITSSLLGSYEIQCNQQHWHPPTAGGFIINTGATLSALAAGAAYTESVMTGATGSGRSESRPYNVYVNYCIRY